MDEREKVRIQREAFAAAARTYGRLALTAEQVSNDARVRYPMPPVTRPRVVTVDGCRYRVVNGRIEYHDSYEGWRPVSETWERIYRAVADLLARPTEVVTEEDA